MRNLLQLVAIASLAACGGGGTSSYKDAAIDSPVAHDAPVDTPPGTFKLTVKNYQQWCSVKVNNGTASAAAVQTVDVASGKIPLSAVALSGFRIDAHMWHHTDGDTGGTGEAGTVTGSGQSASSATTATVSSAAKCVWVCCPFTSGAGCDPATIGEQCP